MTPDMYTDRQTQTDTDRHVLQDTCVQSVQEYKDGRQTDTMDGLGNDDDIALFIKKKHVTVGIGLKWIDRGVYQNRQHRCNV